MDLAYSLNNNEIKRWVENELNGYTNKDDLPSYRKLKVQSYGNFMGFGWSQLENRPLQTSVIPKKYLEYVTNAYLIDPITHYTNLLNDSDMHNENPIEEWPHDLIVALQDKFISGMNLTNAWKLIPKGAIAALIDSVRNRLLSFILEIGSELKIKDDTKPQDIEPQNERITQMFSTIVIGSVNTLGVNSSINISNVVKGDEESLFNYFDSIGISKDDLQELKKTILADKNIQKTNEFSPKLADWVSKMLFKAANGTLKIGLGAAGNLLATAISKYLGLG